MANTNLHQRGMVFAIILLFIICYPHTDNAYYM